MGNGEPFTETKELFPAGPSCPEDLDATEPLELPLSSWVHRGKLFPTVHLHRAHLSNTTCSKVEEVMETHFQSKILGMISSLPKQLGVSILPQ